MCYYPVLFDDLQSDDDDDNAPCEDMMVSRYTQGWQGALYVVLVCYRGYINNPNESEFAKHNIYWINSIYASYCAQPHYFMNEKIICRQ